MGKASKTLTGRQELFCQHFALSGRSSKSAIAAGASPASAGVRANRWLKKANVARRVEQLRNQAFRQLRKRIVTGLTAEVYLAMEAGVGSPRTWRLVRLLKRLGLFETHCRQR